MAIQQAYVPSSKRGPLIEAAMLAGEIVRTEPPAQGWMGVMVCAVPIEAKLVRTAGQRCGLLVERVARGSPAARGGIRAADVLLSVNGLAVTYDGALRVALTGRRMGAPLTVTLLRDGRVRAAHVVPDMMG